MNREGRSWLREPLLHFVVLGLLLFALDGMLRESRAEVRNDELVVTPGRIEHLAAVFVKTWRRPPTPEELRDLVRDHVLEEALYREALALGLDQDDTVVRRRLRQKMEFLVGDVVELAEPTDDELERWFAEHTAAYAEPDVFDFRQVYLSRDGRGEALRADAEEILAELRGAPDQDPGAMGDASLLPHATPDMSLDEVARMYGQGFADQLAGAETGKWTGPFESAYGMHLVFVDGRRGGGVPGLEEVRDAVRRDWTHARREAAQERYYAELLDRYTVTIEWPQDVELDAAVGAQAVDG